MGVVSDITTIVLIVAALLSIVCVYVIAKLTERPGKAVGVLDDHISTLRTGDVVVMPYSGIYAWVVRIYGGTLWTHCGVVLRKGPSDDDLSVVEIAYYEDEDDLVPSPGALSGEDGTPRLVPRVYKNVQAIPIRKWQTLNARHRGIIGLIRRADVGEDGTESELSDRLEAAFKAHADAKINLDASTWLSTVVKLKYRNGIDDAPKDRVFCTELVARLLQSSGIIAKTHRPYCYRPHDFAALPEFENSIYILGLTKGRSAPKDPPPHKEDELSNDHDDRAPGIRSGASPTDIRCVGEHEVVLEAAKSAEGFERKAQVFEVEGLEVESIQER